MTPSETRPDPQDLQHLPTARVRRDPRNPRLLFPEAELERLTESISEAGVLVPVVVYRDGDNYSLIDGERRWRCARRLRLETLPALVVAEPDDVTRLTQMFNIHLVREPWQDMPTAWALDQFIRATGMEHDRDLADRLGLSVDRVQRLRHALELPDAYQHYIFDRVIPLSFFWELKRNVIDPLAALRPRLYRELGGEAILDAFVAKRLAGGLVDVLSFRKVTPIVKAAHAESLETGADEVAYDRVLRDLVTRPDATIEDAYRETVAAEIEFDHLAKRTDATVQSFARAYRRAASEEQRAAVRSAIEEIATRLLAIAN
jgi:ParB/RepB/Spo0J family partition protein